MYEILNVIKAILSGVTLCKGLCAIKWGTLSLITTVQTLSSAINSLLTMARQPMCAPKEIHHFAPALPADAYLRMLIQLFLFVSPPSAEIMQFAFFCYAIANHLNYATFVCWQQVCTFLLTYSVLYIQVFCPSFIPYSRNYRWDVFL